MRLHTLVLKDISRRKTKLGLAVLSVVVAAAAIVAVVTTFSAATDGLYEESNKFGANIIVKPEVTAIPLVAGSTSIGSLSTGENYIEESEIPRIHTIENNSNLAVVAPRLYGIAELGNSSVVVMGVDPEKEKILKPWWKIQGHWMAAETPEKTEVMVGSDIAGPLGLKEGSPITLSQGYISIGAQVAGVIESTGGNEDGYIILPLEASQHLLSKEGKVSSLEVRALCNDCPVEEISRQIEEVFPGLEARSMSQIVETEMAVVEHTESSAMAVSIITLLVSTLTVASTMLASVNEKLKEIGIMRAVGASDRQVVSMLLFEGAIIGIIGGGIGFAIGTAASSIAAPMLVSVSPPPMWEILPAVAGICMVTGMVASIIPAKRALGVDPAEVLRSV
ncbi:ABC transporter, permease protein [Methanosarcina horonobensis HB-1 = JCM 15518]|uniref:ABC transporter, permease protein n=1 Tax=Methanosarcina horonobensis HB-1 = JCM 15518 TaxID=1434110 RepID=A0A0E3WVU0_9EURY|nr:FtsX-like permease family protein [Methanosarcina horonobensis]AKB78475.1 ABC transporter, permease protein [Methanosarcina horonobensis HB-1 = JCM 15518]